MSTHPIRLRIDGIWHDCHPLTTSPFWESGTFVLGRSSGPSAKNCSFAWSLAPEQGMLQPPAPSRDVHGSSPWVRPAAMKTYD